MDTNNKQYCSGCRLYINLIEFLGKSDKVMKTCKKCRNSCSKWYSDNKEYMKKYYKDKNDIVKEYAKKYRNKNKENIKEKSKEYYSNNKESIKEKAKIYQDKNKETIKKYREENKDYWKKYREENKENSKKYRIENKQYWEKYRTENKENIKEYNKQYRVKNTETIKQYRVKNKERYKQYSKKYLNKVENKARLYKYHAKTRNIPWNDNLTDELCNKMFVSNCYYCGLEPIDILNGIDRLCYKGDYEISNCVSCCKNCNIMKGCLDPDTFIKRCKHISKHFNSVGEYHEDVWLDSKSSPYIKYLKNATKRNRTFCLTLDEFNMITEGNCFYCGKINTSIHRNGIDRKNSLYGYELDNCVACCSECNRMKLNTTDISFVEHCKSVAIFCKNIKFNENIVKCKSRMPRLKK